MIIFCGSSVVINGKELTEQQVEDLIYEYRAGLVSGTKSRSLIFEKFIEFYEVRKRWKS